MKILAIRLKNLASLAGPIEIDFTAEPLASAGLFAITGPTGAGKSTLLDALCLALFGSVPRLGNIKRETKVPDADSDIGSDDPRTLLRRGTGSGYAEVDFVGADGRRYRARWEANRARDKANGKLQNSKQSLYDIDAGQVLTSQKREYEALIELRLGLNFEQFTRAVMLAQSEFSAFLKADDKDRSELLEKLTDTAIYSQLGRRAFSKSREAQDAHRELESQASGVRPMGAEERAALDTQYSQAQQQLGAQQAQLKQLEQQHQWLEEWQRLQAQYLQACEQQHAATAQWQNQGPARLELVRLEQLAPQRHLFARQQTLSAQLDALHQQLLGDRQRQALLNAQHGQQQAHCEAAQQALAAAQDAQASAAPFLRQAFDAERDLTRLEHECTGLKAEAEQNRQHAEQGRSALQALQERQQQVSATLAQLQIELDKSADLAPLGEAWSAWRDRLQAYLLVSNRLSKGTAELSQLQASAQIADQQLAEQRATLEVLYREADTEPDAVAEQVQILASLLQDNRKQHRAFEDITRLWTSLHELENRQDALHLQQAQAQQQREQLTGEGLQSRDALKVAEQTLGVTRQLLERQRLARSASVETLREQLHNDEPCPVCGSTEHPYHQPEALLQSMTAFDEQEGASAQLAVDQLKETVVELRERVGAVITRQKEYLLQQEQLQRERDSLLPAVQTHSLGKALLDQRDSGRHAWLSKQLGQLEHSIGQDEARQNALLALQQDAARLQQELRSAIQTSQVANEQLADQQRQLHTDQQRLDEERQAFATLLPAALLDSLRLDAPATFLHLDRQIAERLAQLQQRADEQAEQLERQQRIDKQQVQQQADDTRSQALQSKVNVLLAQQQAARDGLLALLNDDPTAEHWQQRLQRAVEQAQQQQAQSSQALQDTLNQLIQLGAELKGFDDSLQALQSENTELEQRISAWRSLHPELDDNGLGQLLGIDEPQLLALRNSLNASDKAVEQSKVLMDEREQRLLAHGSLETPGTAAERATQLDSERLALQAQVLASEQQTAELRARQVDDQRRQEANQTLEQRIKQAYAEYQRWARINALIGSATGDTFRKIAQAYNLDLLVHHANVQLRQLVRRYRLKRGGSMLGLLVMDTEMGDELRSVHSLSGGETFLVSLALALGLASMASSTLKIESLFIDEGFGSLDPESLQLAMDALDGLQAQGRKVAVISHVQEMHERIPVQIRVSRQGNGMSTVDVS